MPSFDVVSKVDWAEFGNALQQAQKEIGRASCRERVSSVV